MKEGGNALTTVDLSAQCDKGHVTWSHVLYYQLTYRITKVGLEESERKRLRVKRGESGAKANGQC